jgi:hypothetical protein
VDVGLVSGVPHDAVARRVEVPVQRDGQLDDTEVRSEVAAGASDRGDDRLADLLREDVEFGDGEVAEVRRRADALDHRR